MNLDCAAALAGRTRQGDRALRIVQWLHVHHREGFSLLFVEEKQITAGDSQERRPDVEDVLQINRSRMIA